MNIKLQNQKAAYFSKEFNTKPKSITFAMNKSLKTLISAMNAKNKNKFTCNEYHSINLKKPTSFLTSLKILKPN